MKIRLTNRFEKAVKKLHKQQIKLIEDVIEDIRNNSDLGESKKGDLAGIRVFKFKIKNQLYLLSYLVNEEENVTTLLSFGTHENFYRDLKSFL